METLYRKVAVSERLPKEDNWYHTNRGGCDFNPNSKEFEDMNGYKVQIEYWLEEIPDPTAQLQSDKAELLELMEELHGMFTDNADNMGEFSEYYENKLGRIIQKMKQ